MQAENHTHESQLVTEFLERMNGAGDGPAARGAYREGFKRLRSQLEMYPVSGRHASVVFESAAQTARSLAAACLPLGIAVAMHLYPLCVLQCIPLPLLSFARFQRAMLLRTIRNRSLILANAGSERARGADHSLVARQDAEGIRIDGTFEYMSQLREYALRLLDDFSSGSDIQPLKKTTSAMKLRVSLIAQSTMTSLSDREDLAPADAQRLRADASELGYIKSQPTADEIILRSIGVLPQSSASI